MRLSISISSLWHSLRSLVVSSERHSEVSPAVKDGSSAISVKASAKKADPFLRLHVETASASRGKTLRELDAAKVQFSPEGATLFHSEEFFACEPRRSGYDVGIFAGDLIKDCAKRKLPAIWSLASEKRFDVLPVEAVYPLARRCFLGSSANSDEHWSFRKLLLLHTPFHDNGRNYCTCFRWDVGTPCISTFELRSLRDDPAKWGCGIGFVFGAEQSASH